jgi:hypothetical protein
MPTNLEELYSFNQHSDNALNNKLLSTVTFIGK